VNGVYAINNKGPRVKFVQRNKEEWQVTGNSGKLLQTNLRVEYKRERMFII